MYTVNAKTYNYPLTEFSMRVENGEHAVEIGDILMDGFHSVDIVNGETGETISSTYRSDTYFDVTTTPETAIQYAMLYYKNNC